MLLLCFYLSSSLFFFAGFSFLRYPNPPHFLQTSFCPGPLRNDPLPLHSGQRVIPVFSGLKILSITVYNPSIKFFSLLSFSLDPYLTIVYSLKQMVDDLSGEDTSPSKKMFMGTIEFFIDHGITTAVALHTKSREDYLMRRMEIE